LFTAARSFLLPLHAKSNSETLCYHGIQTRDGADRGDERFVKVPVRRGLCTGMFALGTLVVLLLAYIPIVRTHQGWEDEIFWFSTCLSMVRHQAPVPSVLDDFPGTHIPLQFYGPTLFWVGAWVLKIFGATMRSWRSFSFAGEVAFLAAIAVLFRRLRGSWCAGAAAAFIFSLSLSLTFWFSLPGRLDAWTLALIVFAMAIASSAHLNAQATAAAIALRWLIFGALIGVAASTTPRCWPLLFSLVVVLPLLMKREKLRRVFLVCTGCLTAMELTLLPLRSTPWSHLAYVRHASSDDPVNIAPLLGGSWGFGHSATQMVYYGVVLVVLGLLYVPGWREQEPFARYLLLAGLLNLTGMVLLVSRAVGTPTFWSFPLEIVALMGLMAPMRSWNAKTGRALGALLLLYMVTLRIARELPVFTHWKERDPAATESAIAAAIPEGSIVYGPVGEYFYATLRAGSDYRYLIELTTPGLSSIPGELDTPTPMTEACHRPAYLVWPAGEASEPLPPLRHAAIKSIAEHHARPERTGRIERIVERLPAGRSDTDQEAFAVYRLQPDPQYCTRPFRGPGTQ
jgi:hypothetical protein